MVDIIGKTLTTAYDPKERKASPSFNGKILHLDLSNGEFMVFTNRHTNSVNVLYRRKDGNYGLIETIA